MKNPKLLFASAAFLLLGAASAYLGHIAPGSAAYDTPSFQEMFYSVVMLISLCGLAASIILAFGADVR